MNEGGFVAELLSQLRTELSAHPHLADRVIAESFDHLVEATEQLQARGLLRLEAEREAVARFGPPKEVARRFQILSAKEEVMQEKTMPAGLKVLATFWLVMAGVQLFAGLQFMFGSEVAAGTVPLCVSAINATLAIGLWKLRSWSRTGILLYLGIAALLGCLMLVASTAFLTLPILGNASPAVLVLGGLANLTSSTLIMWYLHRPSVKQAF